MPFGGDLGTTPPLSLTANNIDYMNASEGPFTIIPQACTVKALYAALTPIVADTSPLSNSVTVALWKNFAATAFPSCTVQSSKPVACTLPATPITVLAGDALSYVVTIPDNNAGSLNVTLLCQ